jgi:hypothetical protein
MINGLYFYTSTLLSTCAVASMAVLAFLDLVSFRFVVRLFSEWFWECSRCPIITDINYYYYYYCYYYYYYFALCDNFAYIKSAGYKFKVLQICHVHSCWFGLRCLNYISCQICIHFYELHIKFHMSVYYYSSFTATIRRFREVGTYCFTSYKNEGIDTAAYFYNLVTYHVATVNQTSLTPILLQNFVRLQWSNCQSYETAKYEYGVASDSIYWKPSSWVQYERTVPNTHARAHTHTHTHTHTYIHTYTHTHDFLTCILATWRKEYGLVILNNWGERRYVPWKRRVSVSGILNVTTEKTSVLNVNAV